VRSFSQVAGLVLKFQPTKTRRNRNWSFAFHLLYPPTTTYLHGLTRVRSCDIKRRYGNYADSLADCFCRIEMFCLYHGALPRDLPIVRLAVVGGSVAVVSCFKDTKLVLNICVSLITYRSLL
jgi:hypothetical protein